MTGGGWVLIVGLIAGLSSLFVSVLVNELSELSPWLAERLVQWAVRRMAPPEFRESIEEELLANLEGTPGRVFKLATAIGLVLWMPATQRAIRGLPPLHLAVRERLVRWLRRGSQRIWRIGQESAIFVAQPGGEVALLRRMTHVVPLVLLLAVMTVSVRHDRTQNPLPFVVVTPEVGLKIRSSGGMTGVQVGSAARGAVLWADCISVTDFDPDPPRGSGPKWLRIRWPSDQPTIGFFSSEASQENVAYAYAGWVIPYGHNGRIPSCVEDA